MILIQTEDVIRRFLFFLRNGDVIDKSTRGATTIELTEEVEDITEFEIDEPTIKNIREVKLNGQKLEYIDDYEVTLKTKGKITFKNSITGTLYIKYDKATKEKIYPDYPRDDLSIENYPRIGFEIVSISTNPLSLGGKEYISDILISIVVYAQKKEQINQIRDKIRNLFLTQAKNLKLGIVYPVSMGRTIGEDNELVHSNIDVLIKFRTENI